MSVPGRMRWVHTSSRRCTSWFIETPEVRNEPEIPRVAGQQHQIMVDRRGRDEQVHVTNLLPHVPGELAAHDRKPFHDVDSQRQDVLATDKGMETGQCRLAVAGEMGALV